MIKRSGICLILFFVLFSIINVSAENYFLLSKDSYNGKLGGISGANQKCLNEVNSYSFNGKPVGVTFTQDEVHAWLCSSTGCYDLNANEDYYFGVLGSASSGGRKFTTDATGRGPGDRQRWSTADTFGPYQKHYFTGRRDYSIITSDTLWGDSGELHDRTCCDWTFGPGDIPSCGASGGGAGVNWVDARGRWLLDSLANSFTRCDYGSNNLICIVEPQPAGAPSTTSCAGGEDQLIMKISSDTNAHGELWNQGNYGTEICYDELFGVNYTLSDPHDCDELLFANKLLSLSSPTNAHAELKDLGNYLTNVSYGDLECDSTDAGDCDVVFGDDYACIVTLSSDTNAHLATCEGSYPYDTKICCKSAAAGSGQNSNPPVVRIDSPIEKGVYFQQMGVIFSHSSSDSDGSIVSATWDFGEVVAIDGYGDKTSLTLNGLDINKNLNVSFRTPGQKTITLKVKDNSGTSSKGQISILMIRSPYALAYISSPVAESIVSDTDPVEISAEGTFVVNTTGTFGDVGYKVICLVGDCPATAGVGQITPPIQIEGTPKQLAVSNIHLTWTFSNGGTKEGDGDDSGMINFNRDFDVGNQWINLEVDYMNGQAIAEVTNNFKVVSMSSYWANPLDKTRDVNDNGVSERIENLEVIINQTEVLLVAKNTGLTPGSAVSLDICENDGTLWIKVCDNLKTISVIVNADGGVETTWTITSYDLAKAGYGDFLEGELDEIYFVIQGKNSENELLLEFVDPEDCSFVSLCSDYDTSTECTADGCGKANYSLGNIGITCGDGYRCYCAWNGSSCSSKYVATYINESGGEEDLGSCLLKETTNDNCDNGFLTYSWKGNWTWILEGTHTEDQIAEEKKCTDGGNNIIPCPAQIKLPFFTSYNLLIAIALIVLIYFILLRRTKKKVARSLKGKGKSVRKGKRK